MGTKYSSQSASSYNTSPPADDGTVSDANKLKWSYIKTKLSDPLKTLAEAINTALVTAFDKSARSATTSDTAAASDNERTIEVKTASVSVTLSDAATMASGYIVNVKNSSSGNITVRLSTATDTIDGVTNTTVTLGANDWRKYLVNSSQNGYMTLSSGRSVGTSGRLGIFSSSLLSDSGTFTFTDSSTTRAITVSGSATSSVTLNLENTGTGQAQAVLTGPGATQFYQWSANGDSTTTYVVGSGPDTLWSAGVDNSDSDSYVIANDNGSGLGTGNAIRIGTNLVTTVAASTATPANGSSAACLLFGTTAGFGIYYGSGAPTVSAGKGSLYLRSNGTTTNDRIYVNTNGATTWTAITTVA